MVHRFHLWLPLALALTWGTLAGCKQGEGERCFLDSDCDDGLICCVDKDNIDKGGGTCRPAGQCDVAPTDGGADGTTPDQKVSDSAPPDTATPDTKPLPDQQLPDQQLPDQQLPDQQLPDQQLPDQQLPDQQLPDLSFDS